VLKRKLTLPAKRLQVLRSQIATAFAQLVQPLPVRILGISLCYCSAIMSANCSANLSIGQ
jgi:hypothetical protein